MADVHNQDHEHAVLNLVNDAVIADPKPKEIIATSQFYASGGPGVSPKRINGGPQTSVKPPILHGAKKPFRTPLDFNCVGHPARFSNAPTEPAFLTLPALPVDRKSVV